MLEKRGKIPDEARESKNPKNRNGRKNHNIVCLWILPGIKNIRGKIWNETGIIKERIKGKEMLEKKENEERINNATGTKQKPENHDHYNSPKNRATITSRKKPMAT